MVTYCERVLRAENGGLDGECIVESLYLTCPIDCIHVDYGSS